MTTPDLEPRLAAWLADRLGASSVEVLDLERPAAGQSNETVLFTARHDGVEERLVLRRQPETNTIFQEADATREYRVLDGLQGTGVRVPATRWSEPDPSVLGTPFFVMEAVAGRVPLGKPSIHAVGWLPTLSPTELRTLWDSAMDALVAVHAADWRTHHTFLLDGAPEPSVQGHVDWLLDFYRWSADGREFPITDAAAAHVEAHRHSIRMDAPVLVWGDARVGNMIFGDDNTVRAVIDWELATVGPPALDLARWLFFDAFGTSACDVERLAGWPDRDETIRTYEARSGRALLDLELFEVMDELFMASTLIRQADARVANDLAPADTRMGHDNAVTQMLARRMGLPEPGLSPDYLAHRGMRTA